LKGANGPEARRKDMSMKELFNDEVTKKLENRGMFTKAYHKAYAWTQYETLEASVYLEVLKKQIINDPPLLAAFEEVLKKGGTATSPALLAAARNEKQVGAENAREFAELTNSLIGYVDYMKLKPYNAKARFITGIMNACNLTMGGPNDSIKIKRWEIIRDILKAVKDSTLSDTWDPADRARNAIGIEQSLIRYRTELETAVDGAEKLVWSEEVAQKKQDIKKELKGLNDSMEQIPRQLPRFIYNLYGGQAGPVIVNYQQLHLQKIQIPSLLTAGIQQIIGLDNPAYNFCYDQETDQELTCGKNIKRLNNLIHSLGGKNFVKTDKSTAELPDSKGSIAFIKNLLAIFKKGDLILDRNGEIIIRGIKKDKSGNDIQTEVRFPSGFSNELLHLNKEKASPEEAQKLRQQELKDYIEILEHIQELQHGMQLNREYSTYLDKVGELGAFSGVAKTLHEQMESHNAKVATALHTKTTDILKRFARPFTLALNYEDSKKESRRLALIDARDRGVEIKHYVDNISQHAGKITLKRTEKVEQMETGKISFSRCMEGFVQTYDNFCDLQTELGKEVRRLSVEERRAMRVTAAESDAVLKRGLQRNSLSQSPIAEDSSGDKNEDVEVAPESEEEYKDEEPASPSRSLSSRGSRSSSRSITLTPSTLVRDGSHSSALESNIAAPIVGDDERKEEPGPNLEIEEKIPESKVLSPTWNYNAPEKKWVYSEPETFSTARKTLGYDTREKEYEYEPVSLLQSYLPKEAPEEKKPDENDFDYQIRIRNHVATALKDNMIYPFPFNSNWFSGGFSRNRNNGRAARLVLLDEMFDVFKNTVYNELQSEEDIKKMSNNLIEKFKKQKEFFGWPFNNFNNRLNERQAKLVQTAQTAIQAHNKLREIQAWIRSDHEAEDLNINLANIQKYVDALNNIDDRDYGRVKIETKNKLSTYIANDSVIAKQLESINREFENNKNNYNLAEMETLTSRLIELKETLRKTEYSAIVALPAGTHLIREIDEASKKVSDASSALSENLKTSKAIQAVKEVVAREIAALKAIVSEMQSESKDSPQEFDEALQKIMEIDASSANYGTETEAILLDAARYIPANSVYRQKIDAIAAKIKEKKIPEENYLDGSAVEKTAQAIQVLAKNYIMSGYAIVPRDKTFEQIALIIDEQIQQKESKSEIEETIKKYIKKSGWYNGSDISSEQAAERVAMMRIYLAAKAYKENPSEARRMTIFNEVDSFAYEEVESVTAEKKLKLIQRNNYLIGPLQTILLLVSSLPTNKPETLDLFGPLHLTIENYKDPYNFDYIYSAEKLKAEALVEAEAIILQAEKDKLEAEKQKLEEEKDRKRKLFEKEQRQKKESLLKCVTLNLTVLKKTNISRVITVDQKPAIDYLEQIKELLNTTQKNHEQYIDEVFNKLISAAERISFNTDKVGASLILRIAINNIAKETGRDIPLETFGRFKKLVAGGGKKSSSPARAEAHSDSSREEEQKSPAHAEADLDSPEQKIAKAIQYETKRFILSKFGKDFTKNTAIFGENFTEEDFFSKVLEPMALSDSDTKTMTERMIVILKATSMSNRPESEIKIAARGILDSLLIYKEANAYEKIYFLVPDQSGLLDIFHKVIDKLAWAADNREQEEEFNNIIKDYTETLLTVSLLLEDLIGNEPRLDDYLEQLNDFNHLVSPYNTQILRLKKAAKRHSGKQPSLVEDENEIQVTQEKTQAEAEAIKAAIKTHLGSKEEKEEADFLDHAIAIINAEKMKPYPSEQKMVKEIKKIPGVVSSQHAHQAIALAHIHSACEAYRKDPTLLTREELLLTIESVISAVERDYKGKKFGNREEYGKPLKEVLHILSQSPTNDIEKRQLENLSERLENVVLYQKEIDKIEAAKKEVESNLRMLAEAGITPGDSANPATVIIKELNKVREILESLNPTDDQRLVVEALKRAANHVPKKRSHLSLTLRIAINNIASKIKTAKGQIGGEFGKSLPLQERVSSLSQRDYKDEEEGTIGYETKKFILSRFGYPNQKIFFISGEEFTPHEFFYGILGRMYDDEIASQDDCHVAMKRRIIAILKASSMQGKENSEIEIEATQILDCLQVYGAVASCYQEGSGLSDLTNEQLSLSPFNPTFQRLKKYAATPATEEKEMERVQETQEQATQVADAITAKVKSYIAFVLGLPMGIKEDDLTFKNLIEIISTENKKRSPNLEAVTKRVVEEIGEAYDEKEALNIIHNIHIYIAAEEYKVAPTNPHTRENLVFTVETVVSAVKESDTLEYIKALQEILSQLSSANKEDALYLRDASAKLQGFIEAERRREIEAREKAEKAEQLQMEESIKKEVESNLAMLDRAGILQSSPEGLQKIQSILDKGHSEQDRENFKERLGEALTSAAGYVTTTQHSDQSLMVRIAIHNIAQAAKIETPPFRKLIEGEAPSSAAAAQVEENVEPDTIGYEIRKFILSKFGNNFNPAIFGNGFTENDLFEVLEPMGEDKDSSEIMEKRIIELLKATSTIHRTDAEIKREAAQIFDLLYIYTVAKKCSEDPDKSAFLTGEIALDVSVSQVAFDRSLLPKPLSPFNTAIKYLRRNVDKQHVQPSADAAEEKEPEMIEDKPDQIAEAIQTAVMSYINSTFGEDAQNAFYNAYEIIVTENQNRFPDLETARKNILKKIGDKHEKEVDDLIDLLHILIAAEKYQKDPCQYTRDNLLFAMEETANSLLRFYFEQNLKRQEYFETVLKSLETLSSSLSTSTIDKTHLLWQASRLKEKSEKQREFVELQRIEKAKTSIESVIDHYQRKKDFGQYQRDFGPDYKANFKELRYCILFNQQIDLAVRNAAKENDPQNLLARIEKATNEILTDNNQENGNPNYDGKYSNILRILLDLLPDSEGKERITELSFGLGMLKQQVAAPEQAPARGEEKEEASQANAEKHIDNNFVGSAEQSPTQVSMSRPQPPTPKLPSDIHLFTTKRNPVKIQRLDVDSIENIAYIEYVAKKYIESMPYCKGMLEPGRRIFSVHSFRCDNALFNILVDDAETGIIDKLFSIYHQAKICRSTKSNQADVQAQLLSLVKTAISEVNNAGIPEAGYKKSDLNYFHALQEIVLLLQKSSPILRDNQEEKTALIQLSSRLERNTGVSISQEAIQKLKQEAAGKEYVKQEREFFSRGKIRR
jgi:hypothetical protein